MYNAINLNCSYYQKGIIKYSFYMSGIDKKEFLYHVYEIDDNNIFKIYPPDSFNYFLYSKIYQKLP